MKIQIKRFPNGTLDYNEGKLTISGSEASIIPVSDINEITCRDGKNSIFSRHPPLIVELTYKTGLNLNKSKFMINIEEKIKLLELISLIKRESGN